MEKNTLDGIKFIWKDKWVHLRKSNTEPIIRIYAEAPYKNQALELIDKIKSLIWVNSVSNLIDHTNLRPDALHSDIEILCKEAIQYKFASVCINPVYVSYAKSILKDENPKVCSVVGFPLGADSEEMKYAEARFLIFQGVDEIDMVMNIAFLKERKLDLVKNEIKKVILFQLKFIFLK
mgnify:CR=1 FL=1